MSGRDGWGATGARVAQVGLACWLALLLAACDAPRDDVDAKADAASAASASVPPGLEQVLAADAQAGASDAEAGDAEEEHEGEDEDGMSGFEVAEAEGLSAVLRGGEDQHGTYYSLTTKLSFDLVTDERGVEGEFKTAWVSDPEQQEGLVTGNVAPEAELRCTPEGAPWNQSTLWFPHTGVFVRGGSLQAVHTAAGPARTLLKLDGNDHGKRWATRGEDHYSYAACVGQHAVATGWRTADWMQPGDTLSVAVLGQRAPWRIRLPSTPLPYAHIDFDSGANLALPHLVLLTVDVPARRLVLQYQFNLAAQPTPNKLTLMATADTNRWTPERFNWQPDTERYMRKMERRVEMRLARCKPPTSPIDDACTQPDAQFKRLWRDWMRHADSAHWLEAR